MSDIYFREKISDINCRMAVHEGNANQRLASEAVKIQLLPLSSVPDDRREKFDQLRLLISKTLKNLPESGMTPSKLGNIRNKKSAEYIQLLLDIQDRVSRGR